MSITSLRHKIINWIKSYEIVIFLVFICLGWLISWLTFIVFSLIFVD